MKNHDAITILRAAGMDEAVAILEKVTTLKLNDIESPVKPTFRGVLITMTGKEVVMVLSGPCPQAHDTLDGAIKCGEGSVDVIRAVSAAQTAVDPKSRIEFTVIRSTYDVVHTFDLTEKKA